MTTVNPEVRHPASSAALLLDRSDRVRLEVSGPDRAKFLHNLTTNDVKRLVAGQGAETFVTSLQGKTLGLMILLAGDDRILVLTDPGGAEHLAPHLAKYGVFDDVAILDVGPRTFEFHVFGVQAEEALRQSGAELPEAGDLRHLVTTSGGRPVRLSRESSFGFPGYTLIGDRADVDAVRGAILDGGAVPINDESAEPLRIEAGTPMFGRDVSVENLPQEVGRDARAINFVKGCYLGQETVARIDARGHVNRHLRGLILDAGSENPPLPGAAVESEGKIVGVVTSAAYSPRRGCVVALGYVRTAQSKPETAVVLVAGTERWPAIVSDLPMNASATV